MARRRMTVDDDVEILVHWRAGRGIRQIARSLGRSRNTVKDRIAAAEAAGFGREGPPWTAAEWRAALRSDRPPDVPGGAELEALREQINEALRASTAATVWQRLHDTGAVHCGLRTFQRYVAERIRVTDPSRLTVLLPDPAFGEAMEIDYGGLGMYTRIGRPSVPPEWLLRALVLQLLYSIRSERLLMERLDADMCFRWFVGLDLDVCQNTTRRRSAIDGRTTRHVGYAMSQNARRRQERVNGWLKSVGLQRQTHYRGRPRVDWILVLALAVYDLVRLRTLLPSAA